MFFYTVLPREIVIAVVFLFLLCLSGCLSPPPMNPYYAEQLKNPSIKKNLPEINKTISRAEIKEEKITFDAKGEPIIVLFSPSLITITNSAEGYKIEIQQKP